MTNWIEWHGGERPIKRKTNIEVKFRSGCGGVGRAWEFEWNLQDDPSDIIAYRVVEDDNSPVPDWEEHGFLPKFAEPISYKDQRENKVFREVGTPQGHPHWQLMQEYAEVAKTNPRPWEEFEWSMAFSDWTPCVDNIRWVEDHKYRRKPSPPKKQKIKFEAWVDNCGYLVQVDDTIPPPFGWTRLPGLDLETEVDV